VAGGSGLQTQLWERIADARPRHDGAGDHVGRWVITSAHVTGAAPAVNRAVWRVVGAPLVPALPVVPVVPPVPLPTGGRAGDAGAVEPGAGAGAGAEALAATGDLSADAGPRALEGMTVAVKDLFAVEGFAVGAGVPQYLAGAAVAEVDAEAVRALRAAGASVQGIAQTDEFAYSIAGRNVHYGTPPNGAVTGAIPGGSSSGPASAVALGQATIGLGTDTGGSIRVPASYQGLWGIRTTHGAVSAEGLLPLAPSFDTVGWLTRSAAALRAAAAATLGGGGGGGGAGDGGGYGGGDAGAAGANAVGAATPLARRFAVSRDIVASCEPGVREAFDALIREPAIRGADDAQGSPLLEEVDLGDLDAVFSAFRVVQGAEAWQQHGEWVQAHPGVLGPDIAERFDIAAAVTADTEAEARAVLADARERFDRVLDGRVLLLPSASSPAPALTATPGDIQSVRAATLRMTSVAGTGGYPAVSAPLMRVPEPVGLCFVGPRGSDLALIDLAASVAADLGGSRC
jgi:Asp-tRNA(Asn)/Glu-tRNA(Gln) amidotransferase A subunit family amidase